MKPSALFRIDTNFSNKFLKFQKFSILELFQSVNGREKKLTYGLLNDISALAGRLRTREKYHL